jgi:hypothetical protein
MKLTKILPRNKLTKLTNSLPRYSDTNHTRKQTHQTHKLTENLDGNKLTKLTEKTKLTFYPATLRRPIAEISNYIRYLFFSCEFVSLLYLQTCEKKEGAHNIQYRDGLRETHQTLKLTLPAGVI